MLKLNDSSNDDKRNKISKIKNLKQYEEKIKEKKDDEINENTDLKKPLEIIKEKDSKKKS